VSTTGTLRFSARPPFRPRAGSGVEDYDLAYIRRAVPTNAVDHPVPEQPINPGDSPAAMALAERGLLSLVQFDEMHRGVREIRLRVRRAQCVRFSLINLAAAVCILVGSVLLSQRQAPFAAGAVLLVLGMAIVAFSLVFQCGCCCFRWVRLAREQAECNAVLHGAMNVVACSGGRLAVAHLREVVVHITQPDGRGDRALGLRKTIEFMRFSTTHPDEQPLHAPMTLATHGYAPAPGFVVGGDGSPVSLPIPLLDVTSGLVLVAPHDLMSPAHHALIIGAPFTSPLHS